MLQKQLFTVDRGRHLGESMPQPGDTFWMPDEQVTAVLQAPVKFFHQNLLGLGVEINHDIATKNNIVRREK